MEKVTVLKARDRRYSDVPPFTEFGDLLRRVLKHGDQSTVARALRIPVQFFGDMVKGTRRSHFEAAAIVVEQLRRNGNDRGDDLFIALAHRLGYATYKLSDRSSEPVEFARVLRAFADLTEERANPDTMPAAIAERIFGLVDSAVRFRAVHVATPVEAPARCRLRRSA